MNELIERELGGDKVFWIKGKLYLHCKLEFWTQKGVQKQILKLVQDLRTRKKP